MALTNGSPGEYRIRHANDDDGPAVERELGAYLAPIGVARDADELDHDIAEWRVEYDGVSAALLVVEDPTGHVVGTAGVRRLGRGLGELKRMWIRPACQGVGLGPRLMERCLDEARRLGFREGPDENGNPRAEV